MAASAAFRKVESLGGGKGAQQVINPVDIKSMMELVANKFQRLIISWVVHDACS